MHRLGLKKIAKRPVRFLKPDRSDNQSIIILPSSVTPQRPFQAADHDLC